MTRLYKRARRTSSNVNSHVHDIIEQARPSGFTKTQLSLKIWFPFLQKMHVSLLLAKFPYGRMDAQGIQYIPLHIMSGTETGCGA
mmetsp:Transcript_41599/g.72077  ORF Transcript_41599/g.72077 Transcript_41599/m.72077 type:complete len:85 (-) Transcript_41599:8-262(-)